MAAPDQNQNPDPSISQGGFKTFDIPQSKPQTTPPEQTTGGFRTFDTPPSSPKAPLPPVQQPATTKPPQYAPLNTSVAQSSTSGAAGPSSIDTLGNWVAHNRKRLLIGAGGILGVVLLVVVVKYLLSLDFHPSTAPQSSSGADVQASTNPGEKTAPVSPGNISPTAPPAPSNTSPSTSDPGSEMEPAKGYGFVRTSGSPLNLREKPSTDAAVVKSMPNGSFIHILGYTKQSYQVDGESGRWCKISHVGAEGWVWEKFISKE